MTEYLWLITGIIFGVTLTLMGRASSPDCPGCKELEARRACMRWARRALQVALSKLPPDSPANRGVMKQAMMALGDGNPKLWMYRDQAKK